MSGHQSHPAQIQLRKWAPTASFWITACLLFLLLVLFSVAAGLGGFGVFLTLLGILFVITGLFALIFKRRSWIGLQYRRGAKTTIWSGVVVLVVGLAISGTSATAVDADEPFVTATATATPSPSASSIALTSCDVEDMRRGFQTEIFFCTEDEDGVLLWMDRDSHDEIMADRAAEAAELAAAKKAADEKKAEEEAAKKAAAAKKKAEEEAAAKKAAAEKKEREEAAAAKKAEEEAALKEAEANAYSSCSAAAADGEYNIPAGAPGYNSDLDQDGDGIACENADKSSGGGAPAPAPMPEPAPAPAAYFSNCSEARAAGAAPVYRGGPGYGSHLDSDGDGVACE